MVRSEARENIVQFSPSCAFFHKAKPAIELILGPDEVHIQQLARFELFRGDAIRERQEAIKARRAQIYKNGSKL